MKYLRSLRALEGVRCDVAPIEQLDARTVTSVPMRVTPTRRGWMRLSTLRLMRTDPLGVFRAAARLDLVDQVLVLPQRYRVSWHGRGASARQVRQGMSRSRISGSGADFARLREYRPRDPLRHIHWRAWARLGEPVVKEFHEESPSRNALVLDVCAPPSVTAATFEEAVSVAASFVTESNWCSGQLDLLIAGDRNVRLSRDGEGAVRMLEVLACVHASRELEFASLTDALVRHLAGFSTCVLVLLELDETRLKFVRELQLANVHTLVLLVSDKADEEHAPALRVLPDPSMLHIVNPQQTARALASLSPGAGSAHA